MAEEEKKPEEAKPATEGAAEAAPTGIKKLLGNKLVLIAAAVLLVGGIGGGVAMHFMGKADKEQAEVQAVMDKENAKEAKDKAEGKEVEHDAPPPAKEDINTEGEEAPTDAAELDDESKKVAAKQRGAPEPEAVASAEAVGAGGEEAETNLSDLPPEVLETLKFKFDPMVINIFEKNSIHYLKLQMDLLCDKAETVEEIKANQPILRDKLLFIFSDTTLREILSVGGKVLLKEDIKSTFNQLLKKGRVKEVFFTDFTVQ